MRQHVERTSAAGPRQRGDDLQAMQADPPAVLGLRVLDFLGGPAGECGRGLDASARTDGLHDAFHRPLQVHGRGSCRGDAPALGLDEFDPAALGRRGLRRQDHSPGAGDPDQGRAPDHQRADGVDDRIDRLQPDDHRLVRQAALVDDLHRATVGCRPDGAPQACGIRLHAG